MTVQLVKLDIQPVFFQICREFSIKTGIAKIHVGKDGVGIGIKTSQAVSLSQFFPSLIYSLYPSILSHY